MSRGLVMTAGAALAALVVRVAPAAADCLPAADLSGDADVAVEVARALASLGVVNGDVEEACAPLDARVTLDAEGVAVTVRDARGHIEGRVVADARTAAAWIESWVRDDAAPLWGAAPEVPRPAAPARVAVVAAPPSAVEVRVASARTPGRAWVQRPSLTFWAARDRAADGSDWDGVDVAACARLGATCVGLAARHVRNAGFTDTGGLTRFDRAATSLTATAALRVPLARVVVSPEVSIGAGWTTTRRREPGGPCTDPVGPDGMVPCADGALFVGDGFAARTLAARLGAALSAAVPLASWLALDGRVGVAAAPGAHRSPHVHAFERTPYDPSITPIVPGDPLLDLPGEPGWSWTAAIGLRLELP